MVKKQYIISLIVALMASINIMSLPYCDVRKFSITDGLAANSISGMTQSPDRLMWFSTWNGLSYYDGYTFHTFRDEPDDKDILSTNRIMNIYATARNNIWCVTSDRKLYVYDTHLCQFIQVGNDLNQMFNIDLRVQNIFPIEKGNTWITSNDADYIIRTNGVKSTDHKPQLIKVGQEGLKSGRVWFIWGDKKGREWILTDKGTTIYNNNFSTNLPFKWIREVGDNIFLATSNGKLAVYDETNKLSMIPMPAGVTRINQLKNTGYQLLIATNLGMVIYNPRTFKTEIVNVQSPGQPLAEVKNIYTDYYGMVWVFTDGMGVTLVNPKTGQKQWLFADQPDPTDRTMAESFFITQDENHTLWIVPNGGTFSYFDRKAGKLVPYLLRSNSSGNYRVPRIAKFYLSDQGILWINGVHDLTQVAFKEHTYHLNKLAHGEAEVRALCNTPEGFHWSGYQNGIIQITNSQFETVGYLAPNGQIVPEQVQFCQVPIYSLFFDASGRMWIGTKGGGLFVRTSQGITQYKNSPADKYSLPCDIIYDIVADRHGRTWIGTYGGGLALAQASATGQLYFLNKNNQLPWQKKDFQKVRRIFCTPTGEILVGTTDGLISFSDNFSSANQVKFYTSTHLEKDTNSLVSNDVNFIMQHSNGKTYVSELGGILETITTKNLLKNNLKTRYNKQINYNEGIVQSMIEDNQGNLWVVRESSIDKCNLKTGQTEVYGPNDFDYNMSFTEARPAHDPATNNITVGTPMGSLTFNPSTLKKTQYQARVIFTSLHYTGERESEPILHKEKLVIPANKRNLTISFASLDFSRKYQVKYRYRMEGLTPPGTWIEHGSSNVIGFNRIAHGDYVLKVMATNSHGVWSRYIAELPIEVRPTFWESIWGKLAMLGLLMALVASIFYIYNHNQRKKLEHDMSLMKNDFFSDASHKLRTPLTLIGGPLKQVLDTEYGITRQGREMLVIALKNSLEMLEMINKMLRFDNNSNFVNNGGINESADTVEQEKMPGQIDDKTVAKYLSELEKERKDEQLHMTEEEERHKEEDRKENTVLVVEDNEDLRKYLYNILQVKYNVLLAENGKAGLFMARTELPDLILTDVTMPVMDGITMVKEIKQDHDIAQTPIIILSAKASVEDQLKGFEQGIDVYMTKPFSADFLMGRIDAVIKQRRILQADIYKKFKAADNLLSKNEIKELAKMASINSGTEGAGTNDDSTIPAEAATSNSGSSATSNSDGYANGTPNKPKVASTPKTLSQLTNEITEKELLKTKEELNAHTEKSFAFMESQINDAMTAKILKYVTENMGNPDLKIDDIADAMGMSRSVLYSKIKQSLGMTPVDFVRHIRIMRASELLQHTKDSLTSIAFEVGFSDPKYFSKVFKKEMGIVPSEYRERTKEV